jgi:hypothetical protein
MKTPLISCLAAACILSSATSVYAQNTNTNAPAPPPSREEIRQQLQGLSPQERRAKLNELRGKYGRLDPEVTANPFDKLSSTNGSAAQPTSLQASNLARLRAHGAQLTAEQNRARMAARIEELRKKKLAGTLTVPEKRLLDAWDLRLKSNSISLTNAAPTATSAPPTSATASDEATKSNAPAHPSTRP